MGKKKDDPPKKPVLLHMEDYRPVVNIHKLEKAGAPIHDRECCNSYPCVLFDSESHRIGTEEEFARYAVFDDADIHGVTDVVSIQPTSKEDFVIVDAPCCTYGYALKPKQVLALITALQAAYREMKK